MTSYEKIGQEMVHGGVCIYLRSSINYKIRHDLIPPNLEAICIVNHKVDHLWLLQFIEPQMHHLIFFINLEHLLKEIDDENKEIYILGDLNCDLIKTYPDHPTKKLKSLFEI